MNQIIRYSVLRYSPSPVSGESINLGILFSEKDSSYKEFYYSHNFARLKKFDDELDISAVRDMLQGIDNEINDENWSDDFVIDAFTRFYINDFKFSPIMAIEYDDLALTLERLKKIYFRFDYEKKERLSKSEDKKIISEWVKSSGQNIIKSKTVKGEFNDNVRYDIVTDKSFIKIFDFDNKDLRKNVNQAKVWAWNSDHAQKRVYIVYHYSNDDPSQTENFSTIKNIFDASKAKFCSMEEYSEIV